MARKPAGGPQLDPASPILVFHGKEAFLRADHTRRLREKLAEAHGEIETIFFDGTRDALADVLDECRSFGLMQQHKLVAVDNADQLVKGDSRPLMERYAESPADGATLVLRCDTWNKGKLDKMIESVGGEIVKCEDLPPHAALAWVNDRAKQHHGATLPRDAAELLVERIGGDLGRLDSELGKLVAASHAGGGGGTISAELVAELVGMTREEEAWSIQSMMLGRDTEAMLKQLRTILDNTKADQTVVTFFAAMDLCRKLHLASEGLQQGMSPDAIARGLRLWGPSRDAILGCARRLPPQTTSALFSMSVEADRRSKSGLGRPDRLLERVALAIQTRV